MGEVMRTFWLNYHVAYRCRHSGACCSAGWPIPIERHRVASVEQAIAVGIVTPAASPWLHADPAVPDDAAGVLALQVDGHCVWHQPASAPLSAPSRGCAIHSARPLSCVHFPYVCLIDARGVHVTLSHYCPTAASLLFDYQGPADIVEGPSPIEGLEVPEGLDARESLPPAASPARLMSDTEFTEWERQEVRGCGGAEVRRCGRAEVRLFDCARAAVPAPYSWPAAPTEIESLWNQLVEPTWNVWAIVVGRYLTAKVFASWATYLGDGIPAVLRGVEQARSVLQIEVARQCARTGRPLDAALLKEAIRQSDLLLVHYADSSQLVSSTTA